MDLEIPEMYIYYKETTTIRDDTTQYTYTL